MSARKLKIVMVPDAHCVRCGQSGYVGEKSGLCLGCLNISLLRYARKEKEEARVASHAAQVPHSSRIINEIG